MSRKISAQRIKQLGKGQKAEPVLPQLRGKLSATVGTLPGAKI